jgi:hypothetical protein
MPEVVGMLRNIGTGVEPGPAAEYRDGLCRVRAENRRASGGGERKLTFPSDAGRGRLCLPRSDAATT